jgi:hypothetical protein
MKTPDNRAPSSPDKSKGKPKPKQEAVPGPAKKIESPAVKAEKEKFEKKSETLKKTVEKKGGVSKFVEENSTAFASGGLFLLGLITGIYPFMFLGGWLFRQDSKSKEEKKG